MSADELRAEGNNLFMQKNYVDAITCYSEALNLNKNDERLYSNRSGAFAALHQFEQAESDARKTIELKPNWFRGYERLAKALAGQKLYQEAIPALEQALELEPSKQDLQKELERLKQLAENGCPEDEALSVVDILVPGYIEAVRSDPCMQDFFKKNPQAHVILDDIKADPETIEQYRDDPLLVPIVERLLEHWMWIDGMDVDDLPWNRGKPKRSPGLIEQSKQKPKGNPGLTEDPKPKAKQNPGLIEEPKPKAKPQEPEVTADQVKEMGNQEYRTGNYEQALQHYTRAVEMDGTNIVYRNNRAQALFRLNRLQEALDVLNEALAIGVEQKAPAGDVARTYEKLATVYEALGERQRQIEALRESLKLAEKERLRRKLNQLDVEEQDREKATAAKMAGDGFMRAKKWQEAIEQYSEAIKHAPNDATIYSNRAQAYIETYQHDKAMSDCDKAIELDPKLVRPYLRKAHCLYCREQYEEAKELYLEANRIDPGNRQALEGLQRVGKKL